MDPEQFSLIKRFFDGIWKTVVPFDEALIDEIRMLRPKHVLDVGCGENEYKQFIPGLVGLDIVNRKADVVCDILDYRPSRKFDAILCLGSLNFGSERDVLARLSHVRSLLCDNGTIYMRVNPGIRWPEQPDLEIFPWSHERIRSLGNACGLRLNGEIDQIGSGLTKRFKFKYVPTT